MLKKLFKQPKKGFTLIELLVVIGILGILAAALVATIDPVEQLNKAQDANVKNLMVEYIDANIRFYATHDAYPWSDSVTGHCVAPAGPSGSVTDTDGSTVPQQLQLCSGGNSSGVGCTYSSCIDPLVTDSELKASFVTATGSLYKIYVSYYPANYGANSNTLIACFSPVSHSGQQDPLTKWKADGITLGTTCQSAGGANNCYWCTK